MSLIRPFKCFLGRFYDTMLFSTVQHYYTRITHQPLEKTLNEFLSVPVNTYVTACLVIIQRRYVGLQLRANALGHLLLLVDLVYYLRPLGFVIF